MNFPRNQVETVLLAASRQETGVESFLEVLFAARAWFPVTVDERGAGSLQVLTIDTVAYAPVFTSPEEAALGMPDARLVESPVRDFAATLPQHLGLAVNPGGTLGLPIFPDTVQRRLGRDTVISVGTTIRLGEPAEEPEELLAAIRSRLAAVPAVRDARRCWAQVGDAAPGLVVGLDVDPDIPETRSAALAAVGAAAESVPAGFPVNAVFANDGDDFTTWMHAHVEPFFMRGATR